MAEEILFLDALFDVVPPQIFLKFMFFSRNIRKIGLVHPEGQHFPNRKSWICHGIAGKLIFDLRRTGPRECSYCVSPCILSAALSVAMVSRRRRRRNLVAREICRIHRVPSRSAKSVIHKNAFQ